MPSGNGYDIADSGTLPLDLRLVNRAWADSSEFPVMTYRPLVAVAHGFCFWSPSDNPPAWMTDFCTSIQQADPQITTLIFNWKAQSNNSGSGWAQASGEKLASQIASSIQQGGYDHIHLIGHSLGTVVVSETARRLLGNDYPVNQLTLLDAVDGPVYTAGELPDRENPYIYPWEGIERIEHYYGNGNLIWGGGFVDFTPWFTAYDGSWNVGPDIPGFAFMDDYYHDEVLGFNDTIYEYYQGTIDDPLGTQNGWYHSLTGGDWASENGTPGYRVAVQESPPIFNGDFQTQNWAGYEWEEVVGPNSWQSVEGHVRASLAARIDPNDYAGSLDFDGLLPSSITHQDVIIPSDAQELWVQLSENVAAGSAFVVRFNDSEVGRIEYSAQTTTGFHFVSFDLSAYASQIGRLKFILDGYQPGDILIDNIDIGLCTSTLTADFNCSHTVDILDLAYLASRWLTAVPLLQEADLSGDAWVDLDDFARFAQQWFLGVEP